MLSLLGLLAVTSQTEAGQAMCAYSKQF